MLVSGSSARLKQTFGRGPLRTRLRVAAGLQWSSCEWCRTPQFPHHRAQDNSFPPSTLRSAFQCTATHHAIGCTEQVAVSFIVTPTTFGWFVHVLPQLLTAAHHARRELSMTLNTITKTMEPHHYGESKSKRFRWTSANISFGSSDGFLRVHKRKKMMLCLSVASGDF